jgi:NAD(P)-dependent dehydrogenase (short-subunit alcohol dehydrogenase family)
VVTGGTSGIGLAISRELAASGLASWDSPAQSTADRWTCRWLTLIRKAADTTTRSTIGGFWAYLGDTPVTAVLGFAVSDDPSLIPVLVSDHRRLEQASASLADIVTGDAELIEDVRGHPPPAPSQPLPSHRG